MKECFKLFLFCLFLFQLSEPVCAQQKIESPKITVPFTVYKSVGDSLSIEDLIEKNEGFHSPNITSENNNSKDSYWVRADFSSLLPTLQKDSLWYLQTGSFFNISAYFLKDGSIHKKEFGSMNSKEKYTYYSPKDGIYFGVENLIDNQYLFFKIKFYTSKEDFGKLRLQLRSAKQKTIESNYYRWEDVVEASRDYLFVGAFFIIFVFTFLTYLVSKRLDFLFYSLYTFCLLIYLGRSAYNIIVFLAYDYTVFSIWLHSNLQIFINLFYVAFAKHYLETSHQLSQIGQSHTYYCHLFGFEHFTGHLFYCYTPIGHSNSYNEYPQNCNVGFCGGRSNLPAFK